MYQLGIGISIAGTKSYVELDIAKLPQLAGTWKQILVTIVSMLLTQVWGFLQHGPAGKMTCS